MSANGEEEDDVSNIFNRNSGSNNHPQSRPHIGDDDIDIEENQHGTSHSDLFNRSNHNSEDGDEFMADPENRLETLIEELQSMYHLNNHYGPLAAKSVKCPANKQFARTFYAITAATQAFESSESSAVNPKNKCADQFKDFICEKARLFITKTDIEAYTATLDKHGDPLRKSLLKLTRDAADNQTNDFKAKYFPEGYAGEDLEAKANFRGAFNELVKHVRGQLRDLQILSTKKIQPDGPVPCIDDLIHHIIFKLLPRKDRANYAPAAITWKQRIRISHLRLEATSHYLSHYPKSVTQWNLIDQRLDVL
ncbi:hypothetical protein PCANC_06759 [Puccinia coronata f. sp. avenae]|uniref:Uncharacterized protein n=1 Tax=Puccinia coronata f. sp. avenae TaxID=200324 RepID=A0A2N5VDT7_9BASI|nr:hypothetical protein PCANC_06759 [Puccinia coronata f. sp. avenae]